MLFGLYANYANYIFCSDFRRKNITAGCDFCKTNSRKSFHWGIDPLIFAVLVVVRSPLDFLDSKLPVERSLIV